MFFDQKQDRAFGMNFLYSPDKADAFEAGLVCVTQNGRIVHRPDPLQRRQDGVGRVDVRLWKLETQGRRQGIEEMRIVFNDKDTRGLHNGPIRKMIPMSRRQGDDYCTRQHVCHYMIVCAESVRDNFKKPHGR